MGSEDALFVPAGRGQVHHVLGGLHVNKAVPADTGGAFTLIELTLPPRMGPPAHSHARDAEAFYILEGEITFETPTGAVTGTLGDVCILPAGGTHAFRNDGDTDARALVVISPGEDGHRFFSELDARVKSPADFDLVPDIGTRSGIAFR